MVSGSTEDSGQILLVGSSGGHLAQLLALEPWYRDRRRAWVTFDTPDARSLLAGEDVLWAHHPTTRNVKNLVRNAFLALKVIRRRQVDAVVTTGAGVALPFVVAARMRKIPTVYIEVYDRIDSATLTARLCRPFLSAMLVQWDEQRRMYPEATVVGNLL
ncbi:MULTISPECIES: UDP-N-acetylglucosamine--LPS N-acetylglucosamine transferase [unclassified Micromonospora]|uniref:UDP-N-acetylglucosamine--LPS N-acetylglucosamine transferase n=1 Tax=unclassified Micromonospora TaxID=2617518 RepID=UPI001C22ACAB|nr:MULTISPECIES: UDP-N-acetylglucosamine--LPS N-acetylglucosamine transferase [unclassified Micromonospora]MBU8857844.1 UDP-N-acetylglucosamine--LPS N-acetylglucosamine transferase [Micromonospora sp. WMMB482]MDM4783475.1 UDP-N-acetylglucosamine--LPS N-acetylglucosamine transferase [Micromonospora sp. b486]